MRMRARRDRPLPAVAALFLLETANLAMAAPDVAGTWLFRSGGQISFVAITTRDGSRVSFAYEGVALEGTLSDSGRLQAQGGALAAGKLVGWDADVSADGRLMNASAVVAVRSASLDLRFPLLFGQRCACVDGNAVAGDGCDADCQVEPCWSCSGEPARCVLAADGTPCTDAAGCRRGAMCAAGACEGGVRDDGCFDLTGTWAVHAEQSLLGETTVSEFTREIRQRGGHLLIRDVEFGGREYFGSIDAARGTFGWTRLTSFDASGLCSPTEQAYRQPYTGSVAADGLTLAATGVEAVGISRCPLAAEVRENAVRATVSPPPTPTATPTATTAPPCAGDCDGNGDVTVDELVKGVNIALGSTELVACPAFDADGAGSVTVDEVVAAVNRALAGCP